MWRSWTATARPGSGAGPPESRPVPAATGAALFARRLLDLALPPRCAFCRGPVADPVTLCGACWSDLDFVVEPLCGCCGRPFAFEAAAESLCGACMARRPAYDRARSALIYAGHARALIQRFKFRDETRLAPLLAIWAREAGASLLADADWIAPVPLHWMRLYRRRYNQSALLAGRLAARGQAGFAPDMLRRIRRTRPQTELGRNERGRNVAGAFRVAPVWRNRVGGARIVIVDDVLTTGATLEACARALKRAGAARVDALTVARVDSPDRA